MSTNKISSSSSPQTSYSSQVSDADATGQTAPMSKADSTQKTGAASAYLKKDEVTHESRSDAQNYFAEQTKNQTPARQRAEPQKSMSLHELQRAQQSRPSIPTNGKAQLDALTATLEKLDVDDFAGPRSLGSALQDHFDTQYREDSFEPGLRDLFDNEKTTRKALSKALSHIPKGDRADAVDAVMEKLEQQLSGVIQRDMKAEVNLFAEAAKQRIVPFCGEDSTCRIALMHGLVSSGMSQAQMEKALQKAGLSPDDAEDIAEDLIEVRSADPSVREALSDGARGKLGANEWDEGYIYDGDLRNIEQALHEAFDSTLDNIENVQTQATNDQINDDKMFTNPLFEQAFKNACSKRGIEPGTDAYKMLDDRTSDQRTSDKVEALACAAIMSAAAIAVPGGIVVALGTGAVSSAPGVMVAQNDLDAARGGLAAGTNDVSLVNTQETNRNIEVGMAVVGLLVGVAGNLESGAAAPSALDDVMSNVDMGSGEGLKLAKDGVTLAEGGFTEGARNAWNLGKESGKAVGKEGITTGSQVLFGELNKE